MPPLNYSRAAVTLVLTLVLSMALLELGSGAWLLAKAQLAQLLIHRAWQSGIPSRPWPWADTWPVARLQFPGEEGSFYVLADSGGEGLAFGPTLVSTSGSGATVIAGHRDTHFRTLGDLQVGDDLLLEHIGQAARVYQVAATEVVDSRRQTLRAGRGELLLVTCYPFEALNPGGPLRYIVRALPHFIPNPS